MKNKFYFLSMLFLIVLGSLSCNKEDDGNVPCSGAWATDLSVEINAVSNAGVAYSTDPTPANCTTYKNALQVYLNALQPYGDCATLTGEQRAQWEVALGEAQESVNEIECN